MTQNNLGIALRALGEREPGTKSLDAAVEAFRAALEVRTRDKVPLAWATTQNGLGVALATLGERKRDPDLVCEALQSELDAWEVSSAGGDTYNASKAANNGLRQISIMCYKHVARRRGDGAIHANGVKFCIHAGQKSPYLSSFAFDPNALKSKTFKSRLSNNRAS